LVNVSRARLAKGMGNQMFLPPVGPQEWTADW
jgi:hypothetical protein